MSRIKRSYKLAYSSCSSSPVACYEYRKDKKLHRVTGPAIEYADGTEYWYKDGKLHRKDGPAVIRPDGTQIWYQNGKLHRTDGPAIVDTDGSCEWHINGVIHREDGPAYINWQGDQFWYRQGNQHREDGPAFISADKKHMAWYLNDVKLSSFDEWCKLLNLPEEDILVLKLKYNC